MRGACVSKKEEKKGNLEEFRVKGEETGAHQRCQSEHMEGKSWWNPSSQWAFKAQRCILIFNWHCLNVHYVSTTEHNSNLLMLLSKLFCEKTRKGVNFKFVSRQYGLMRADTGEYNVFANLKIYWRKLGIPHRIWGFQPILFGFKILEEQWHPVTFLNKESKIEYDWLKGVEKWPKTLILLIHRKSKK